MADRFIGKRATVMGLGTRAGGVGVARFLAERGAVVTVTDLRPEELLAASVSDLGDLPIRFVLGRHEERDFLPGGADLIVRNPGVPRRTPLLAAARAAGVPVEMEMSLFFRSCSAPVIGITGTKGKTSTASLCAGMLRAWDRTTVLAGNMGVSALGQLARITAETPVVVELSSWQLEAMIEHGLSPGIAVLTNISEDHLDHYDGFEDYAATKRGVARFQRPDGHLVVNAGDAEAWRAASATRATVVPFGLADRGDDGAWWDGKSLVWRWGGQQESFVRPASVALRGEHGIENCVAAIAAAMLRGATPEAVQEGLDGYRGVPHRMEVVAEIGGVTFVNDTAATAPAAGIAALRAFAGTRIRLIAGGADKRTDLSAFAQTISESATDVFLLEGSATQGLAALIEDAGGRPHGPFGGMREVLIAATSAARPGDVVLLSPGCASFGLFRDEFDRGEQFRATVCAMKSSTQQGTGR